jgi:hypothetical protein
MVFYHHQQDNMIVQDSELLVSVINDLRSREERGKNKYKVTMDRNDLDLRSWLQHALEECYDQALYLKKAIKELDSK